MLVIAPQQGGSAKGGRQPSRTVDHASDYCRVVVIRRRNCVNAQDSDAKRPAVEWNRENVDRVIVLDGLRGALQVRETLAPVEPSGENFRESRLWRAASSAASRPVLRIMDREGYRIQVALEVEAGFLDEALVFRIVRNRKQKLSAIRLAGPTEVGIDKAISAG